MPKLGRLDMPPRMITSFWRNPEDCEWCGYSNGAWRVDCLRCGKLLAKTRERWHISITGQDLDLDRDTCPYC